ncbi:hypothetical protein [Corallococcus sp. AS-1-6]|uniref:hypothetical protein n=1 Tax=Corallococcus sp. AS-1-6 TaxID=2874599 RepID=UPI001CBCE49C|nr:hypothetical protein [Corallococcus sp. AS-1-6]MBZ4373219.1 hypothetical protein [Corallococcus sp. AS-1-6]
MRPQRKLARLLSGRAPVAPRPQPELAPAPAGSGRGLRLLKAVALAADGVLLAVQVSAPKPPEPTPAPLVEYVPATVGDVVMTDMIADASAPQAQTIERRLSMPSEPLEGQARPPCQSPAREVNRGCWLLLGDEPPCPKNPVEHKDRCYAPVQGAKNWPASIRRQP